MTDNLLLEPNSIPVPIRLASLLRDYLKTRSLGAAMFLQQLHYWTQKECGRIIGGVRWIWNTYKGWLKNFPCWSEWDFRIITKKLRELGLIEFCQPNDHERNRTGHYRLNYDHKWLKSLKNISEDNPPDASEDSPPDASEDSPPDASEDSPPDITDTTSENSSDTTNNNGVVASKNYVVDQEDKEQGTQDKSNNNQIAEYLRRLRLLRIPTLSIVEAQIKKIPLIQLESNIRALEELASRRGLDNPLGAFFACIKDNWQPKNDKQAWWNAAAAALGRELRDKLIRHVIEIDGILSVCFSNRKILPFDQALSMDWEALAIFGGESL